MLEDRSSTIAGGFQKEAGYVKQLIKEFNVKELAFSTDLAGREKTSPAPNVAFVISTISSHTINAYSVINKAETKSAAAFVMLQDALTAAIEEQAPMATAEEAVVPMEIGDTEERVQDDSDTSAAPSTSTTFSISPSTSEVVTVALSTVTTASVASTTATAPVASAALSTAGTTSVPLLPFPPLSRLPSPLLPFPPQQ
jgi:hypothetical protein